MLTVDRVALKESFQRSVRRVTVVLRVLRRETERREIDSKHYNEQKSRRLHHGGHAPLDQGLTLGRPAILFRDGLSRVRPLSSSK